jgi:hypothetical protein
MKRIIKLTEDDLTRIVRRVIKEGYPDDFNAWASRDFSPGSPTYERDMERRRKEREEEKLERERNKYNVDFMDPQTGREWKKSALIDYVKRKFGVDLPYEIFTEGNFPIWRAASKYLKSYFNHEQ